MHIDDALLYQAIEKAADAPNHGMREPWRVVHVPKDRLGDMSKDISKFAFPNELDKQQCHYDAVTKLGGMLLLILKQIQDNVKMMKTTLHLVHMHKILCCYFMKRNRYMLEIAIIYL